MFVQKVISLKQATDRFQCRAIKRFKKINWKPSSGRSQENEMLQKTDI